MKNMMYLMMIAVSVTMGLTACNNGGSGGGGDSTGVTAQAYGNCAAGQVFNSQYGCLPQGSCQAGYGQYNGGCVVGTIAGQCGVGTTYPYNGYPNTGYAGYPNSGYPYGQQQNCGVGQTSYPGYNGGFNSGFNGGYPTTNYMGGSSYYYYYFRTYGSCSPGYSYYNHMCVNQMTGQYYYAGH